MPTSFLGCHRIRLAFKLVLRRGTIYIAAYIPSEIIKVCEFYFKCAMKVLEASTLNIECDDFSCFSFGN